jgi:hypothetical protein
MLKQLHRWRCVFHRTWYRKQKTESSARSTIPKASALPYDIFKEPSHNILSFARYVSVKFKIENEILFIYK